MRKIALIFFILFIYSFVYAEVLEVDSRISAVTVYPDSALITRVADLKLRSGIQTIIFPNIIPELDENSFKVSSKGQAEIRLLKVELKKEFLEETPQERLKKLQDEIQILEDEKRRAEDNKKILLEEKQFLDSIRLFSNEQLPKDLVTKMPSVKDLDEMFKFLDTKLKENYMAVMDVELKLRDLYKKIDVLKKQLAEVSSPRRNLKRSIVVELEVIKPGTCELGVSYLVKGASWEPIYDARADFDKSEVELVSYAIVRQKTGEDWLDIELSVSTAKPAIGGRMPYVNPWFIKRYYDPYLDTTRRQDMRPIASQYVSFRGTRDYSEATTSSFSGIFEEKGIGVNYKLLKKVTVKSDGSEHKLPISSQILTAKFVYSTYPRALPYAYLGSRVTNAPQFHLLAGRVNIFLEGDFVGSSSIDTIGPGEEFDLYLGVDENVKVKREQVEKKIDNVLIANIPAPIHRTTFKYKITIENYKNKKIKVIFFEAMPVSEDERIKVRIDKVSLEPKEKDWDNRKGIWRWELELEPRQKQEIFYTFSIEHPRDMKVEGL